MNDDFKLKLLQEVNGVPYVEVADLFTEEELTEVWKTLDALVIENMSRNPTDTGMSVHGVEGDPLQTELMKMKQCYSMFLNHLYSDPYAQGHCRMTQILIPKWQDLKDIIATLHPAFRQLSMKKGCSIVVSYYGDGDRYEEHTDEGVVTAMIQLSKDESKFEGGELALEGGEKTIPFQNNKMIVIPGHMRHAVKPVSTKLEDERAGLARWSVNLFM